MIATIYIVIIANVFRSASSDDPEAYMSEDEMIQYWGYPLEVHNVTTADGYILDLVRIPYGRFSDANESCHRPAVLCVHGLGAGSAEWVINPPESSPAFILADAGFDVFLLNQRGTTRGKQHVSLKSWDNKFWQFSLDEFAKYDAPAVIDKALELSGQSSLYWIGESQGTLVGFMTLAETPAYNSKEKALVQITPVGTGYVRGLARVALLAYNILNPLLNRYRQTLGSHEFAFQLPQLLRPLSSLCEHIPILGPEFCSDAVFLVAGPPAKTFNSSRIQVYVSHLQCGTSTWNVLHWGQIASRQKVEHMDHNPAENLRRYGQLAPPSYDYTKIDTPVYLFWSRNDWLTTEGDIKFILNNLRKEIVKEVIEFPEYNHADFGAATDIADKIYPHVVKIVRSKEGNMCER